MTDSEIKALAKGLMPVLHEVIAERTAVLEARVVGLERCVEELQTVIQAMAEARSP